MNDEKLEILEDIFVGIEDDHGIKFKCEKKLADESWSFLQTVVRLKNDLILSEKKVRQFITLYNRGLVMTNPDEKMLMRCSKCPIYFITIEIGNSSLFQTRKMIKSIKNAVSISESYGFKFANSVEESTLGPYCILRCIYL